jgi:hypothetical protein
MEIFTWSLIGCACGVISACLPTLTPLLRRIFIRFRTPTELVVEEAPNEIVTIGGTGVVKPKRHSIFGIELTKATNTTANSTAKTTTTTNTTPSTFDGK